MDPFSYGPEKRYTFWGLKWWVWLLLMGLLFTIVAFVFGWLSVPLDIFSRRNVQEQWQFAYEYNESLQAIAQQVCNAEDALAAATGDEERIQRQTQLTAYQNNYARVAADYDARLRNAFEGGLVAPPDVPNRAPSLQDMQERVCP